MLSRLEAGYALERLRHFVQGEGDRSKRPALLALARVLNESGIAHAITGGVALQVRQRDPRTTLDIDVAVRSRAALPRERLRAAGFRSAKSFEPSENRAGPDGVPVQVTDDPALHDAIARAAVVQAGDETLRALGKRELLCETLRAGSDPARRRSRRVWIGRSATFSTGCSDAADSVRGVPSSARPRPRERRCVRRSALTGDRPLLTRRGGAAAPFAPVASPLRLRAVGRS